MKLVKMFDFIQETLPDLMDNQSEKWSIIQELSDNINNDSAIAWSVEDPEECGGYIRMINNWLLEHNCFIDETIYFWVSW